MKTKGSLTRSAVIGVVAALTALAGLAFAPGAGAAANYTQTRFAGTDRFDTAALISAAIAEATPTAVIARADIYPDALTGAFAAAANGDGPLLLTRSDSVPQRTIDSLNSEGVTSVVLLGGTAAISTAAENQLRSAGKTVRRIGGATRYDTAADIARDGAAIIGTIDGKRTALLSSGENFPDALSGAPLSFAVGLPSLLTPKTSLHPAALSALRTLNITQVLILGGSEAVAQNVEDTLRTEGFSTTRLAGGNRSATSVEIFKFGLDKKIYTNRRFGIARGDTFPDALAYAPLAGRPRATVAPNSGQADTVTPTFNANGLLLAAASCTLSSDVENFIIANQATWTRGEILGGTEAICPAVADQVLAAASFGRANVTLTSQQTTPGGTLTGNITGANIASVTVQGCGLAGPQTVTRAANGNFSVTLPPSQTTNCTLTFTTTFTDGTTEIDQFPITIQNPGDPNVTLSPTSGVSGSGVTATFSGNRTGVINNVSSGNCTVTNQAPVTPTSSRTFNIAGTIGTACQVVSSVTFSDAGSPGSFTDTDTFTITDGTTPPPPPAPGTGGVSAGAQLNTATPDLTRVDIVEGIANDGKVNQVRYTFNKQITTFAVGAPAEACGLNPPTTGGTPVACTGRFSIQGFDSDVRLDGTNPRLEAGLTSILVDFVDTIDLRNYTIGTADDDAVSNGSGGSALASKALTGSIIGTASGVTQAPVLVTVDSIDQTNNRATFVFDKAVTNPRATEFGFYNSAGTPSFRAINATIQGGVPTRVIVTFAPSPPISSAVRFFANDVSANLAPNNADSAVESNANNTLDNALGHFGPGTGAPDLTAVTRVANQPEQVDFTFDLPVQPGPGQGGGASATEFALYDVDGTRIDGQTVTTTGDPNTLRVFFNTAQISQQNADQFTRAGAEEGATRAAASPNTLSTVGGLALGAFGPGAGFTDGPDLLSAVFTESANQVRYTFDEDVSTAVAGGFFVINAGGASNGIGQSAVVSGRDVTVNFLAGSLAGTVGAGVVSQTGDQINVANIDSAFDIASPAPARPNSPDSVGRT